MINILNVLLAADRNNDAKEEENFHNPSEGYIGFGNADFYDTREVMEMAKEDPGIGIEHDDADEVKNLKSCAVATESKKTYRYSIINFYFTFIKKIDR